MVRFTVLVIYDIDGVLADVSPDFEPGSHVREALEALSQRNDWKRQDISRAITFFERERFPQREMVGLAKAGDRFSALARIGLPLTDEDVALAVKVQREVYAAAYDWIPGAREHLLRMRYDEVSTATLSDRDYVGLAAAERLGIYELVDDHFDSCLTGKRKPEPGAYQLPLQTMADSPESTIYSDDRLENVLAANALGMNGVLALGNRGWANDHRHDPAVRDYLSRGGLAVESLDELVTTGIIERVRRASVR